MPELSPWTYATIAGASVAIAYGIVGWRDAALRGRSRVGWTIAAALTGLAALLVLSFLRPKNRS